MNRQVEKKLLQQGHEFIRTNSCDDMSSLDKPFLTWFWEVVLGNSSEEYRREFYRELHHGHTIGPSPISFGSPDFKSSTLPYSGIIENDLMFRLIFLMVPGSVFWLMRHIICTALRKMRRSSYYERERERRIQLGITRRSIRLRKTVNREPTVDEIRAAWNGARHNPEGALRLGGMLEDLECYVNNLTIGNKIEGYRGRHGGIKRHLQDQAPDLFEHYAALMRYKSIARRFRQACEIGDPVPTDALLPLSMPGDVQQVQTVKEQKVHGKKGSREQDAKQKGILTAKEQRVVIGNGQANQAMLPEGCQIRSEQIKQFSGVEQLSDGVAMEGNVRKPGGIGSRVQKGVKSWVLDGFVFAWRDECWIKRESYESVIRVLRACENSLISLEAAIALEIDPNFVTRAAAKRNDARVAREKNGQNDTQVTRTPEKRFETGAHQGAGLFHIPARVTTWVKRRSCVA